MTPLPVVKAHAFGNDFILVDARDLEPARDLAQLARAVCERHRGIGADGLIVYSDSGGTISMRLVNADGSRSEISGNGVRCLGAWIVAARRASAKHGTDLDIRTDAGPKHLELLGVDDGRYTCRAAMGAPEQIALERLHVCGSRLEAITLRVGNPQCVVLGAATEERLHTLAAALAVHPRFPEGTNVELAEIETPDRVRILIWERGVGPTEASGTGACAAAVAAIQFGGASRDVQVASPGGVQRVEWTDEGLFLTGWATIVAEAKWLGTA